MSFHPHEEHDRFVRFFRRVRAEAGPWRGDVFRSTTPSYPRSRDLVSGLGARAWGGRWNPPGSFATVYASLTAAGAMDEVLHHFAYYGIDPAFMGRRIFCVLEARLRVVIDLTDGTMRRRLGISAERMRTTDWRRASDAGEEAITQAAGRAAYECGIEALIVPAAPSAEEANLVAFPDNLMAGSTLYEKPDRIS